MSDNANISSIHFVTNRRTAGSVVFEVELIIKLKLNFLQFLLPLILKGESHTVYIQCDAIRWEYFYVLDSFNRVSLDEDRILDNKYEKHIFWDLYHEDSNFNSD